MNRSESKYFNTAIRMDQAFLELLDTKDFEYITVKEICERAGVNRSTFYLHYETIADLLEESVAYMERQFHSYFGDEGKLDVESIGTADMEHLYLITPQYLRPYLQYVKDHRRLFKTVIAKSNVFDTQSSLKLLFEKVMSPIMDRYRVAKERQFFIISYYINGIISVIKLWIEGDCKESVDFILEIITECVKHPF